MSVMLSSLVNVELLTVPFLFMIAGGSCIDNDTDGIDDCNNGAEYPSGDILKFQADTRQWMKIGDLQVPRCQHGISTVSFETIRNFCRF